MALQQETWGVGFSERVPPTILQVSQRVGGVTAGAFALDGRMLGFVFGLTGVENGRLVHWSDMLAVREEARGRGIGRRLKEYQRDALLPLGVETIYWTFDPLVARNGHLNLNRLGVRVAEYVVDMYGETDSELHRGIGTDRLVVAWDIGAKQAGPSALAGSPPASTEAVNGPVLTDDMEGGTGREITIPPESEVVWVEIPADIREVQASSLEAAARWRRITRAAFTAALQAGYAVAGMRRDLRSGRCFYRLTNRAAQPEE